MSLECREKENTEVYSFKKSACKMLTIHYGSFDVCVCVCDVRDGLCEMG